MRKIMNQIKRNSNNKGSTLVTVIISISLVGILASLVLIVTQNSYVTKSVDSQSKNNFYSAEEVIDQLKLGIQNEIAASMVDAYYDVIANFNINDNADDRKKKFKELTLLGNDDGTNKYPGFISKIAPDTVDSSKPNAVDLNKLNDLISDYYNTSDKYRLDVPKKPSGNVYVLYEYDTSDYNTITIRNIGVEYYNSVGYVNGLFTDIVITIPSPNFNLLDPNPNTAYEQFSIMARKNIELTAYNKASIKGNMWVGDNVTLSGSNVELNVIGENSYIGKELNIGSGNNGDNYLFGASNGTSSDKMNFCVGNISLGNLGGVSRALKIDGNAYVKNDLVFEGDNSMVSLAGSYHGLGYSGDTADSSSAIIVNGKNNILKADGLTQISVSGSSFIKTYDTNETDYTLPNNSDLGILTGDSISPRSNELAYLVPSQYMKGLPNPVTSSDLHSANYDSFSALEAAINSELELSPLATSGQIKKEGDSYVKVILYTYSEGSDKDKLVAYYYLNFASATAAATFYNDENYVKESTKNMLLGLIPIKMSLTSGDFKVVGVNVNVLDVDDNGLNYKSISSGGLSSGDQSFVAPFMNIYKNIRSFLTPDVPTKLQEINDGLPEGSRFSDRDAIDNIINWDAINSDPNTGYILHEKDLDGILQTYVKDDVVYAYPLRARIYKGDSIKITKEEINEQFAGANGKYHGIFISTGDIELTDGVEMYGLIIAGGNIYIKNGSYTNVGLNADRDAVKDIFNRAGLVHTKGGVLLSKILNGFDVNNTAGTESELETISLDNMFTYENWASN